MINASKVFAFPVKKVVYEVQYCVGRKLEGKAEWANPNQISPGHVPHVPYLLAP